MSGGGSARYPVWCLDDRIFSPQYETITPTQVLSGDCRQGLMRKREIENTVYIVTEGDRFSEWNNSTLLFFQPLLSCWDIFFVITINTWICTILSCSQKKLTDEKWRFWRVVPFWKVLKDVLSAPLEALLQRDPASLLLLHHDNRWKNLFQLRRVWNKNLGRIFYFAHFLFSSVTNILCKCGILCRTCLVLVQ